jgi:hypothetical protein
VRKKGDCQVVWAYEVLKLTSRLLDNAVLPADHDTHPTQIADLGAAHYERVDIETAPRQDPRHARKHTGLVLHETVQHVPT